MKHAEHHVQVCKHLNCSVCFVRNLTKSEFSSEHQQMNEDPLPCSLYT